MNSLGSENIQGAAAIRAFFKKDPLFKAFTLLALVALFAICGLVWGTFQVMAFFKPFTSDTPLQLPVSEPSPDELAEIQSRIRDFLSDNTGSIRQLRLSANDLNALIAAAPGWNTFRGRLYFTIINNQLAAEATFPLRGLPFVEERYLNGHLELGPIVMKKRFSVGFKAFKTGDRILPSYLLGPMNQFISVYIERRTGEMGVLLGEAAHVGIDQDALVIERHRAQKVVPKGE